MPTNPFDDMPPPIEEKKQLKSSSRSKSTSNINNSNNSNSPSKLETKLTSMKSKLSIRKGGKFNRKQIDDISVSDSLCSGVLRDAAQFNIGNSIGSSLGMRSTLSSSNSMSSLGNTHSSRRSSAAKAPIPGGVADFDESLSNWKKINTSVDNSPSVKSAKSLNSSSESVNNKETTSSAAIPSSPDTQRRREQRKERVKEKLDRYKRDQKALKKSCLALEQQLAITTDKLREVDSKAAFKIDALESELRETRKGMEGIAKSSNKEVTDQSECIKTLGKKLIRQAHVIKRQKNAVEQYKIQLEAMNEEMAMQDERDSEREAELEELEEQLDSIKEQKSQMNNLLQENIEEMRILKGETEKDAKNIMELEFNLQQKEATLDRVAKDVSEKAMKISELEENLEEKNRELDALKEELKESENSVQTMQQCLESASRDSFLFKQRTASGITDDDDEEGGGEEDGGESSNDRASSMSIGASMASSHAGGGADALRRTSQVSQANSRRGSQRSWFNREASARSSFMGDDGEVSPETFEAELNAKDTTIATLNDTVTEHEETINTLRSEMVKMSSTYKQDSYLKRKEIAKLKQQNAEYALKLRALEKAFKCVNATEGMSVVGSNFHGHTSHGGGGSKHGGSLHGNNSRHSRSTHSVGEVSSKIDKAAAVKARLGGFPYEFPSASSVRRDSAVVQEANFFDDGISEQGSDLGMKGQSPEEN